MNVARRRCDQLNDCHRVAMKTKHHALSIQANGLPRVFAMLGHDNRNEMEICARWHWHFDGDSFQSHCSVAWSQLASANTLDRKNYGSRE